MKTKLATLLFCSLLALTLSTCQSNPYVQGEGLYHYFCANCHMDDGTGLQGLIPPLKGADYLQSDPLRAVCIIRNGLEGAVTVNDTTYNQVMPALPEGKISAFEITNIINYVNQAWGNNYGYVEYEAVKKRLETCKK